MMKRILITGVNGFVGRHTAAEFLKAGYSVLGIGGRTPGQNQKSDPHEYRPVDLLDERAVRAIDLTDVDGVIHLAGLAAVSPSFDEPRRYVESNTAMQINLFEAARAQNIQAKFVIISSGSLYDPASGLPLTESSPVLPNSPYAVSKLAQEQLAQYYTTRGFEIVIARPFNHIGPGQNTGFIVPDIVSQAVGFENVDLDKITVGNLDARRDYTDVRDIARAYRMLFEEGKSQEIYNICSGKSLSGHELLADILAATDVNPEIVQDPAKMRPSDTPEIYGSHDKLTSDTGWVPEITFKQTIADVVADWRRRLAD